MPNWVVERAVVRLRAGNELLATTVGGLTVVDLHCCRVLSLFCGGIPLILSLFPSVLANNLSYRKGSFSSRLRRSLQDDKREGEWAKA